MNEVGLGFDKVPVRPDQVVMMPDAGSKAGAQFLLVQFNPERCGNAAMSLGLGQAAFDYALDYTKKRHQFGRSVAEFQGIQWQFADMAVGLDRKSVVSGKSVSVRVDVGGRRLINKKKKIK